MSDLSASDVLKSDEDFLKGEKLNSLILKIIILKRLFVGDAIEAYNRQVSQGIRASHYEIRARLINLFDDLKPYLKRSFDVEVFNDLEGLVRNGKIIELLEAWDVINQFLYDRGLLDVFEPEVVL